MRGGESFKPGAHISELTIFNCSDKSWAENIKALGENNYIVIPINGRTADKTTNLTDAYKAKVSLIEEKIDAKYTKLTENTSVSDAVREKKTLDLQAERRKQITDVTTKYQADLAQEENQQGEILCANVSIGRMIGWKYSVDEQGNIITNDQAVLEVLKYNINAVRGIEKNVFTALPLVFFLSLAQQIINVSYLGVRTEIDYTFGKIKKK